MPIRINGLLASVLVAFLFLLIPACLCVHSLAAEDTLLPALIAPVDNIGLPSSPDSPALVDLRPFFGLVGPEQGGQGFPRVQPIPVQKQVRQERLCRPGHFQLSPDSVAGDPDRPEQPNPQHIHCALLPEKGGKRLYPINVVHNPGEKSTAQSRRVKKHS